MPNSHKVGSLHGYYITLPLCFNRVAHLAGKLVEKIHAKQSELEIAPRDILCVKIAGLCHDLGRLVYVTD